MDEQSKEYRQGYEDGVRELARRLETYYTWLGGSKTIGYMVQYTIREKVKDMMEEVKNNDDRTKNSNAP